MDKISVKCYSGHIYAGEPRSFTLEGSEHVVTEVEGAWLEPGWRCFLVRTAENQRYRLCYNEAGESWTLTEVARRQGNA